MSSRAMGCRMSYEIDRCTRTTPPRIWPFCLLHLVVPRGRRQTFSLLWCVNPYASTLDHCTSSTDGTPTYGDTEGGQQWRSIWHTPDSHWTTQVRWTNRNHIMKVYKDFYIAERVRPSEMKTYRWLQICLKQKSWILLIYKSNRTFDIFQRETLRKVAHTYTIYTTVLIKTMFL